MKIEIAVDSLEQTACLGRQIGSKLRPGDIICLFGDLGAGKTTITKSIALGMGLEDDIHSPTFNLIHEHKGTLPLYHIDLYRLESELEIEGIGIEEYLDSDGATIIEWADRMQTLLPDDRLDVEITITGEAGRLLRFETNTARLEELIRDLKC